MKKLITLLLFCGFMQASAQTTITASYASSTVTFSTGLTYITFAIRNNNTFPIVINDLSCLQANLYENNAYNLYYSPTSLSGFPTVPGPGWTLLSSSLNPITTSVITYVTPFDCLGLTIPAGSTYRFALQGSKGTAVRGGVTPNIFSSGGVDLLVGNNVSTGGQVGYFGWTNVGVSGTAYYFDGSITFSTTNAYTDLSIRSIIKPSTVCSSTSSILMAEVCNKSPHSVNFLLNPISVNFNVAGPISQTNTISVSSGTLPPCGCTNVSVGGVNFSSPGTYTITATSSITGVVDANTSNNSKVDSVINYKPLVAPTIDSVCQFSSGPLFSGFNASNCLPRNKSITATTLVTTPASIDGSNDASATLFAQGSLPGLPTGAVITGGKLVVTNLNCVLTASQGAHARFSIYAPFIGPSAPLVSGQVGSPLSFSVYNFDYSVNLSAAQLNNLYSVIGAGGNFNIGYWESVDDVVGGSDIILNAQSLTTQAQILIDYTIVPDVRWYTTPVGGTAFTTGSPMNPFTTMGSGLANTNTVGNYTFYVACSADTICREPVVLKVKPSPGVVQDSMQVCEGISSSGNGTFDLTSISNSVSASAAGAVVDYYQDLNLSTLITTPSAYISNSGIIYSKVNVAGCYASDTVLLTVHPKPQFVSNLVSTAICEPEFINASLLIDPFSTTTPGTDTLFFEDAAFTISHPSPYYIASTDTVFMLFVTNTIPECKDTMEAIIQVYPISHHIVNQDTTLNVSIPGNVGCAGLQMIDGSIDTLHASSDCSRIAVINDIPNGISLGNTTVCELIDTSVQYHNGQPYVNRHYQITPTQNDSAIVCLFFLDDDLIQYNNAAFGLWPLLPTSSNPTLTSNLCIAQIHNGDLNTPGHTVTSIPNTSISSSYDPLSTVWTICFPVVSFSYFYLHSQNPLNIPLSVQLNSFKATKINDQSLIEWTTLNEKNNQYFVVERSKDGKQFYSISNPIQSKSLNGNSSIKLDYSFVDVHPFEGMNYYRLIQFDIDGQQHVSEIVSLLFNQETFVSFFPNPTQNDLNVNFVSSKKTLATIKIQDATGRVVQTIQVPIEAGSSSTQIELGNYADGIYLISVTTNTGLNYSELIRKN